MARSSSPLLAIALIAVGLVSQLPSAFVPPASVAARQNTEQAVDAAKVAVLGALATAPAPAMALQGEEDDGFDLRIIAVLGLPLVAASWALFNVWRVAFRQGARIGETVSGSSKIGLRAEE
mmetsp:Transcript_99087/g.256180  ORF Transcript_99087/g.256180 Transcript_99087/m.256180 type:complete len:121 (+) Transcript_99087:70-432(+)